MKLHLMKTASLIYHFNLLDYSIVFNKMIINSLIRVSKMFLKLLEVTRKGKKRVTSKLRVEHTNSNFYQSPSMFEVYRVSE